MTAIRQIRKAIQKLSEGEVFTAKNFRHIASESNLKQILSRLSKEGVITRSARGVYVKSELLNKLGLTPPSAREIAKVIADSTAETIVVHGAEAVRQFHLSTQVPMKLIFYTNGRSRTLTIDNQQIELRHLSPSRLLTANSQVGLALSALVYLGRENVNNDVIEKIKRRLTSQDFSALLKEMNNMPAWLASAFYYYLKDRENDK